MNLCACDIEEREHGVGAGVNATKAVRNTTVVAQQEGENFFFSLLSEPEVRQTDMFAMVVASQRFVQHARSVWLSPKASVMSMLLGGDDWLGAPLGVPEVVYVFF
jgi:hypothetical protein